ncbi:hypothetical protein MARCHEWKA_01400 [Brevundimonas phage vB_BpoS-Marchewka]|uniref:Uncharacterized protein n=1 Tax=Brevundimonas phage vB_BpoS-Marchewka TaxID=2948604 RepID=A0A9E7SQT5_9CAUD|nr:hypothetical protein MARCHEWKA_01400 [Brevundimonas phage vB_BpoS-Marchewka]
MSRRDPFVVALETVEAAEIRLFALSDQMMRDALRDLSLALPGRSVWLLAGNGERAIYIRRKRTWFGGGTHEREWFAFDGMDKKQTPYFRNIRFARQPAILERFEAAEKDRGDRNPVFGMMGSLVYLDGEEVKAN